MRKDLRYYKVFVNGELWYYSQCPYDMKIYKERKGFQNADVIRISKAEYDKYILKFLGYDPNKSSGEY
jgi:hypothetical protein